MKNKTICIDSSGLFFPAVFNYERQVLKKIEDKSDLFILPPHYVYFNSLISCLKKIGVDDNTRIIIALEGKSWRKNYLACLDQDTDILTENGWINIKNYVENKLNSKVATLNNKKYCVEYQTPTDLFKYYYEGDMYKLGGKHCKLDVLMTPNHKHFWKRQKHKEFSLDTLENISNKLEFESLREFPYKKKYSKKYFVLPKFVTKSVSLRNGKKYTYIVEHPKKKILMDDWLEFLGWYLSEGCCGQKIKSRCSGFSRKYSVVIPQSTAVNSVYAKEIRHLLKTKMGYNVSITNRNNGVKNYVISDVQLANYLKQFGTAFKKHIPRTLLNTLTKKQCKLLLQTLIKGDGSFRTSNSFSYTTVSKRLVDDIQELALKAGYTCTYCKPKFHSFYCLSISKDFTPRTKRKIYKEQRGFVYCLEVPNHTFFIRKSGKVCWTGNSYKAQRAGDREKHTIIDWEKEFENLNRVNIALDESTNWYFVREWNSECDDIIAVACRYFKDDEVIVVSGDGDLKMLAYYPNVKFFSIYKKCKGSKGMFEHIENPLKILSDKARKGDVSDNIIPSPSETAEDVELRYMLVNLLKLPDEIENKIIEIFDDLPKKEMNLNNLNIFKNAKEKFLSIYKTEYQITPEYCYNLSDKRKKRKENEKGKKTKKDRKVSGDI
jgi:ribosomal protein S19/bifunctional DNA-binding transcriptional regulator/antitoxin component of YhaV-PrlF toxin-antitoxin module